MLGRRTEFILALVIYIVTMGVLFMAVYWFLENWHLRDFNLFIAGALMLLLAMGLGYVLSAFIFAPTKKMETTLTALTDDIIHELNIPLATISANVGMLKKSMTDEKSSKRLQRVEDASKRLARLYDELVYTINKEIHDIPKVTFDVKEVVKERVSIFQEQQRNPFVLALESYEIEADKIGFEQMLDNIIINAMKYSEKSAVITISLASGRLCIEDCGIGMSSTELLRIHERYFQGDTNNEGKGIGLSLVKTYCDSEGFQMHISSQKNQGTFVCLTLITPLSNICELK